MRFVFGKMKGKRLGALIAACITALCLSCAPPQREVTEPKAFSPKIESIVVIGFRPLVPAGQNPAMVLNPLSGSLHYAEPVSQELADELTGSLFSKLKTKGGYQFFSPGEAKAEAASFGLSHATMNDLEMYQKIGESLSVDAVMAGYIYRWQERKGAEYGVDVPASVAFDLYLLRVADKTVLWRERFDKTQQSLSENVLDYHTFLKARGRWMSALELAELGLDSIIEQLPKAD
jgi:hypothetical protein